MWWWWGSSSSQQQEEDNENTHCENCDKYLTTTHSHSPSLPLSSLLSLIFQLHLALRLVGLVWRAAVRWTAPLTSGVKRRGPVFSSAAWWKLRASTGSFCVWWASTLCVWPSSTTINLSGSQQPSVSHTQVHYHTSMQLLVLTAVKNVFFTLHFENRHSRVCLPRFVSLWDDFEDVRPRSEELFPLLL